MSTTTITITVPSNAFGTLAKLYSAIQDTGARAQVNHNNGGSAEAIPAPAVAKRKPGRPPKNAAAVAPAPAEPAPVKRGPGRPKKIKAEDAAPAQPASGDAEDKFSKWHSSQKTDSGRGKYFSAAEVKQLLPKWEAALKEYQQAAGAAAEGGRTTKNWSIAKLQHEAQQAHRAGGGDDTEGSPSSKPKRARSRFTAAQAAQAAKRKPRGRAASKKTTDH